MRWRRSRTRDWVEVGERRERRDEVLEVVEMVVAVHRERVRDPSSDSLSIKGVDVRPIRVKRQDMNSTGFVVEITNGAIPSVNVTPSSDSKRRLVQESAPEETVMREKGRDEEEGRKEEEERVSDEAVSNDERMVAMSSPTVSVNEKSIDANERTPLFSILEIIPLPSCWVRVKVECVGESSDVTVVFVKSTSTAASPDFLI
jgi:hypothetical protein